jgi:membrane protein DedA with SNARE-associated domain
VTHLLVVPPLLAYLLIGLLVFAEAALLVGFVLPGETAVLLGGVMAASGRLSLSTLLPLVVLAALAGDSVGYELGRRFGPRLLASRPLLRHADRLASARLLLRERGGAAVFLARFTAFLRAVMPALAGLSRMPYGRFLVFNVAGGISWGVGVTLLGLFAGHSVARVETMLGRGSAALLVAVLLGLALLAHRRRRTPLTRAGRVEEDA